MSRDIAPRVAAGIVGLFFVRDGIYGLLGKEMWVAWRGAKLQKLSGPIAPRLFGLVLIFMAMFMFALSWAGFE
jgi:hypothetical protein